MSTSKTTERIAVRAFIVLGGSTLASTIAVGGFDIFTGSIPWLLEIAQGSLMILFAVVGTVITVAAMVGAWRSV